MSSRSAILRARQLTLARRQRMLGTCASRGGINNVSARMRGPPRSRGFRFAFPVRLAADREEALMPFEYQALLVMYAFLIPARVQVVAGSNPATPTIKRATSQ